MNNRAMYVSRPATSWRLDACANAAVTNAAALSFAAVAKAPKTHMTHTRLRAWSPPSN